MAWLLIVVILLYWFYCAFPYRQEVETPETARAYFIADRQLPSDWYILAATATSFSGWTFVSHPGMIYDKGFQTSFISFYAITIAFSGMLFLKRQWIIGKRYNCITPGDMFGEYFKSEYLGKFDLLKILISTVAILFSVLYIAVQLRASGYLINTLIQSSPGGLPSFVLVWVNESTATITLALFLLLYVVPKGLKQVAFVDRMQFVLQTLGMIIIGILVLHYIGGLEKLAEGLKYLSSYDHIRNPFSPDQYSHYFSIPGIFQPVHNFKEAEAGGWTGMLLLTFMLALMGIQTSPAFTMWAFANESPKGFWIQQVIFSSLIVGLVMLIFTTIQGIGAHFLVGGSDFALAHPEIVNSLFNEEVLKQDGKFVSDKLIPNIILHIFQDGNLYIIALFLAIAGLAAMQSTASSYILTVGAIITRDLLGVRGEPKKEQEIQIGDESQKKQEKLQINTGRFASTVIVILAIILALIFPSGQVALWGGLAVAFGLQMVPALVAICWYPFLTRTGIIWGLSLGILTVIFTENPFDIFNRLGFDNPMRWPLTIHSAAWGLLVNFVVAFIVSIFTQYEDEKEIRNKHHDFLKQYNLPQEKQYLKPFAWLFVLTWFFLAVGPGAALIGNDFFGNPNDPSSWWFLGAVPIWAWQAVFWAIGVFMMWFLAYYMEMSTMSDKQIAQVELASADHATIK